jgi:hypothetical protein
VPVLVTNENGVVKSGDLLTISTSTPGYAMKQTEGGYSVGRAISSAEDVSEASVLMVVENRHRAVTVSSIAGLDSYTAAPLASTQVPSTSIYNLIAEKISHGNTVVTEYLALSVKGVSGYFDKLFAKEIYTEKVCVKKSDGTNVCLTGDQVESMLNTTQIPLMTAPSSGSGTGSSTGDTGTGTSTGTGTTTSDGSEGSASFTGDTGTSVTPPGDASSTPETVPVVPESIPAPETTPQVTEEAPVTP